MSSTLDKRTWEPQQLYIMKHFRPFNKLTLSSNRQNSINKQNISYIENIYYEFLTHKFRYELSKVKSIKENLNERDYAYLGIITARLDIPRH